jgi:hypothetical protein
MTAPPTLRDAFLPVCGSVKVTSPTVVSVTEPKAPGSGNTVVMTFNFR